MLHNESVIQDMLYIINFFFYFNAYRGFPYIIGSRELFNRFYTSRCVIHFCLLQRYWDIKQLSLIKYHGNKLIELNRYQVYND